MNTLYLIFYIIGAVCFAIAALFSARTSRPITGNGSGGGVNFVALGLLFWILVPLIVQAKSLN